MFSLQLYYEICKSSHTHTASRIVSLVALASLILDNREKLELQVRYQSGLEGYGHFKKYLKELIWEELGEAREKREYYLSHMDEVNDILSMGAKKARAIADTKMSKVRDAIGL